MKTILTLAGSMAAIFIAGCATQQTPESRAKNTGTEVAAADAGEQKATIVYTDKNSDKVRKVERDIIGKNYLELNRRFGPPVNAKALDVSARSASTAPASATYRLARRLDVEKEIEYARDDSLTLARPIAPRYYVYEALVKADFDLGGIVTNAVVNVLEKRRTSCSLCTPDTPCVKHDCKDGCKCPAPCGCDKCPNKAFCDAANCNCETDNCNCPAPCACTTCKDKALCLKNECNADGECKTCAAKK